MSWQLFWKIENGNELALEAHHTLDGILLVNIISKMVKVWTRELWFPLLHFDIDDDDVLLHKASEKL